MATLVKFLQANTPVVKGKKSEFWMMKGDTLLGGYYGKIELTKDGTNILLEHLDKTTMAEKSKVVVTLSDTVGMKTSSIFTTKMKGKDNNYSLVKGAGGKVVGYVENNMLTTTLFKTILGKPVLSKDNEVYVAVRRVA